MRLSALNRNHPVADAYIYNRTVNLAGRLPAVTARASNLHAHFELGRSRHDLSASCQWGHDFLFHRGPGLEVAADTRLHRIGAAGTIPLLPSLGLRYRLSTTTGLMTSWAPLGGPAYDPELRRVSGNLEIGDPSDASAWAVGMTREATRTGESGCRQGGAHDWGTLYARLADLGTTDFEYALDLSAVLKGRESRLSAGLRTRFRPSSRLRIDAGIAHAPVPFTFDHGYRYWTTTCDFDTAPHELPGFTYLAGTTGYHDYDAFESTVTAVDLGVGLALAGEGSIALGYFSRSFSDLNLESYQSLPDFLKNHWPESWADIDGSLQGVRGDLALTVRDGLRLTLGGEYRLRTGSDEAFTQRLQAIPRFIAVGLLAWAPHPSLSLTLRGRYTSATCWSEYRHQIRTDPVDPYLEELTRYVDPDLAAGTALDLSVGKWFWGRRLRWVLVGHNLLNRRLRSHPAGAGFDLSLATRFELHLGTDR